ncbi:MAG: hypothetical protein ABIK26_07740 [Candidatus Omnitrophota bacterium]
MKKPLLLSILTLFLVSFSAFADLKTYYEDLDNDGNLETVTVHQKYRTPDNMPPLAGEGIVTVYDEDLEKAMSFVMPDRMGKVEFVSLNKDGSKQIVAWSSGGAHYTNLAIYGYSDGELHKLFKNGTACLIKLDFDAEKPTIRIGRANWEKKGWSYAAGGHGDSLWQVYVWNGKEFILDKELSTTPEISEGKEAERYLDKAKSLMGKTEKQSKIEKEIAEFARQHKDFEQLRPIMHEISLRPENENLSLQELYDKAKKQTK